MPPSRARSAFTLFELVLTLVLLAGAATIGIHWWFGRPAVTLRNAAELLAEDLAIARSLAIAHQAVVHVHVLENGYSVTDYAGQPWIHPRTGRDFVREYDRDAVFEGVVLDWIRSEDGRPLVFSPEGAPSSASEARLTFGDEHEHVHLWADGATSVD